MTATRLSMLLWVLILSAGCNGGNEVPPAAATALHDGAEYELLSLDPDRTKEPPADNFHGWRVLGRTKIADAATRKKLNDALRAGARENDGMVAACFNPRHGITVKHEGRTHDLVICFECMSAQVFIDGVRQKGFLTTNSPQKTFDAVLTAAEVPLPGDASD